MTMIEARDVCVSLGGKAILDHIRLTAGRQQVVGLIGPNGSGKSTLLKCIYRVLQPDRGAVFLEGRQDLLGIVLRHSVDPLEHGGDIRLSPGAQRQDLVVKTK